MPSSSLPDRIAFDLYKGDMEDVDLPFNNPFGNTTLLGYNYKAKVSLWWWREAEGGKGRGQEGCNSGKEAQRLNQKKGVVGEEGWRGLSTPTQDRASKAG